MADDALMVDQGDCNPGLLVVYCGGVKILYFFTGYGGNREGHRD
jgi:hypothetical protein